MITAMVRVGGYDGLMTAYSKAEADPEFSSFHQVDGTNLTCFPIQENFMHMFRPADAPGNDLPWTGLFTGMLIGSLWYWCADQVIVQRTLASKNISHAKGGVLLAGTLKFLPLFLLVIPGMAARVLYKNEVGCSDPEKCEQICESLPTHCSSLPHGTLLGTPERAWRFLGAHVRLCCWNRPLWTSVWFLSSCMRIRVGGYSAGICEGDS